jgi:uncharacterized protein (DUF1786 family)
LGELGFGFVHVDGGHGGFLAKVAKDSMIRFLGSGIKVHDNKVN